MSSSTDTKVNSKTFGFSTLRAHTAAALLLPMLSIASSSSIAVAAGEKHSAAVRDHSVVASKKPPQEQHGEHSRWGYQGATGPDAWASLSHDFERCGAGQAQSPIDFVEPIPAQLIDLTLSYRPSALRIINNGHTIQVNYDKGSSLQIDGENYELLQFHFHSPSEHTVDGRPFPLEAHFVHRSESGQLAVLGAFIRVGDDNLALAEIWRHLPTRQDAERMIEGTVINANDLLPQKREYYRYMGSLTTPPCSEGVKWFVMKEPVPATAEQVRQFTSIFAMNARPVRPVNGRLVLGE